jgi:hypothetical protein
MLYTKNELTKSIKILSNVAQKYINMAETPSQSEVKIAMNIAEEFLKEEKEGSDIAIVATTREKGNEFFNYIVKNIRKENVLKINESSYMKLAEFNNGDSCFVIPSNDSSRGYKYDQVFIEIGTDINFVNIVVLPSLIVSNVPEEDQVIYFYKQLDNYIFYQRFGGINFYTRNKLI